MSLDRRQFLRNALASAMTPAAKEIPLLPRSLQPVDFFAVSSDPGPRIEPNDYLPHALLREKLSQNLYIDSVGKSTIGIGFNVQAPGAIETLRMHGVDRVIDEDIPAAEAWKLGEWDNRDFEGRISIGPVIAHALYLDRAVPAIKDAYDAIQNSEAVSRDRMMVVLDMRYNLGGAGFKGFKGFLAAVNAGDYNRAAFELMGTRPTTVAGYSHSQSGGRYIRTKWYGQTGNRAIINVQVMRGAALPSAMPDRATMQALSDDNDAFFEKFSTDDLTPTSPEITEWLRQTLPPALAHQMLPPPGTPPEPPPPSPQVPPPLLLTMQQQGLHRPSTGPTQPQAGRPPITGGRQQPSPSGQQPQPQQPGQTAPQIPPAGGFAIPGPPPPPQGFPPPSPPPQPPSIPPPQ